MNELIKIIIYLNLEASDENTENIHLKNVVGTYARSRWPIWLYSIPRPVQRIKRKQHLVNLLARMNKRGSWLKNIDRV